MQDERRRPGRFRYHTTTGRLIVFTVIFAGMFLSALPASAQYFGRNKVQYDDFDFQKFRTDHFEFYFYPEEEVAVKDAARMAERWYQRHSRTFLREFAERKPIIFYANDADFQQTNAIQGSLGQGTGGVTEALKERVIMPLTGSYADTDHVLGHELVHSFQYDIALNRTDSSRFALGLMPLWLVEGMAEYFSVGRDDPHTAMWMRDAAIRDDVPTIEKLSRGYQYFPYRYGQALLAYVGGKYGDAAVANLFKLGGRVGVDSAVVYTLGIKPDSLSNEWISSLKEAYLPLVEDRMPADSVGRVVLASDIDAGDMNVSPVVSPDGQYVAFLSERDLFNINLFIADAETGEVVKKLKAANGNSHFDAIRFINSAGSWSPDGQRFAFVTFVQGDNEISILDWRSGSITRRISVDGVSAITNPAWSPDGQSIVFSGLDGGISDLYLLNLETDQVTQLTNDRFSDLQPAWAPDSRTIAFVTDRGEDGTNFATLDYAKERIGLYRVDTGEIDIVKVFDGVHTNPQFSPDGRSIFFISDHDGFKDVYRYGLVDQTISRLTYLQTGVSGITTMSPAMTVAGQSGRMVFSVFGNNRYNVHALEADETVGEPYVVPDENTRAIAGVLPPYREQNQGLVANYLADPLTGLPPDQDYEVSEYGAKLTLDYVAPPTIGVTAGGPYGSGLVGGVGFFFSDMLGNHNLSIVAQANGSFKDVGGQAYYLNRENRLNYGGLVGHIPILLIGTGVGFTVDPETNIPSQVVSQFKQRIYIDQVQGIASYPFTQTRRLEFSGGFTRYGFDYEVDNYYFSNFGVRRERTQLNDQEPDPVFFGSGGLAIVNDFSFFGFTSPVRGGRSRFELSPFVGSATFLRATVDYRRYLQANPVTLAIRGLHVGNYGAKLDGDSDNLFTQEYLGYANSRGFLRGYSFSSFNSFRECTVTDNGTCAEFDRLRGSRIALASAELRVPFFGTEQFGLINFPYLPTEISLFADAGLAWTAEDQPTLKWERESAERVPVFSTGVTTRFNLFGYTVLEIFYAKPWQRPGKGAHFGFQIVPGW
ncbi:MAG: PD40 domain-containing protein [Rhodothermales bacterium]|nr:PD40 domain-containing protein [Rhodothermales bacterium]MBO6778928.1 PD40 domain-containing protein [Rhodothermales bacterium]